MTTAQAAARLGARLLDEDRPRWHCPGNNPSCTTRNPCSDGCRPVAPDRASNPFLRPPPTENQP